MRLIDLDPEAISPVNGPFNEAHLEQLIESMRASSWQGRPLLVEEAFQPGIRMSLYFAWTGSHRLAAARQAPLPTVPCLVMASDEANAAFTSAGYQPYWYDGYSSWRDRATSAEGMLDPDRLRALEKTDLKEAVDLLRKELEATDGHGA